MNAKFVSRLSMRRVGIEHEHVEAGVEIELAHDLDRAVVLLRAPTSVAASSAPDRRRSRCRCRRGCSSAAPSRCGTPPVDVGGARLHDRGEMADFRAPPARRPARESRSRFLLVTGDEEVVVVEDEDVDAARLLQLDHLVGHVARRRAVGSASPAGSARAMPRCNRTCSSRSSRGSRRAARCRGEARRRIAAAIGPGHFRQIGQTRLLGANDRAVRRSERETRNRASGARSRAPSRAHHRLLGLLPADGVDLGKVGAGSRPTRTSRSGRPAVTCPRYPASRSASASARKSLARATGTPARCPTTSGGVLGVRDRRDAPAEIAVAVERRRSPARSPRSASDEAM